MNQDERFFKRMKIEPCVIPEPSCRKSKADFLPQSEIEVERCGEFITMTLADFQTMLSANGSLAEGARRLQDDLAVERQKNAAGRQWRNAFLLLACGISAILLIQLVQWVRL